jgi:hypothetical protein
MYSREVSLKPPFLPLHNGVRMASVITTSSAFFEVLLSDKNRVAEQAEGLPDA